MRPMSASVVEPAGLDFELIYDDQIPLETRWHRIQIGLLVEVTRQAMAERERTDYAAEGNMFVYWSVEQARAVATEPQVRTRHFRGPDFFFVDGAQLRPDRKYWVVWEEGGQVPDVVVELLSPTTAALDRGLKKEVYERSLGAPELFHYDPDGERLDGWRRVDGRYRVLPADGLGRIHSRGLGLWLGTWEGHKTGLDATWLRLFDSGGRIIPTPEEAERLEKETERARADAEQARADAAEAELARLRARLGEP